MKDIIEELYEASTLEGAELGEYWNSLIQMYESSTNQASEEFIESIKQEIIEQHRFLKENFRIVEQTSERVVKYTTLEFIE